MTRRTGTRPPGTATDTDSGANRQGSAADQRAARLKAALKANLGKRKAQARARANQNDETRGTTGEEPASE